MRIDAVSVCVNYGDFLAESAKYNQGLFDSWTIVTEPGDEETREVCRKLNLRTILSEDGKRFGKPFSKGRLVERGLHHIAADGWRLHIDADIVLPPDFRKRLTASDPQEDTIYGIDRLMVQSWSQWQEVLKSGYLHSEQYGYHCRIGFPKGIDMGSRWAHPHFGYIPIGFFQLWHSSQDEWKGIRIKPYPHNHNTACRTDVQHGFQWDRHKRALIPEILAFHLESESSVRGANWNGRTTRRFGPKAHGSHDAGYCKK